MLKDFTIYSSLIIIRMTKSQTVRLAGHVPCLREKRTKELRSETTKGRYIFEDLGVYPLTVKGIFKKLDEKM
jgi:hypothetical protein